MGHSLVVHQVLSLLLHHVHVYEEGVEPEVEHLVAPPKPRVEELDLDVAAEWHGSGQRQLCVGVRSLDVLVHLGRVDLRLVQTNDEKRC